MQYQELQRSLEESGIPLKIEECHAIVCANLCINPERDDYLQICGYLARANDWAFDNDRLAFVFEAIAPAILESLKGDEMDFALLLPTEESADLASRAQALANWGAAFLVGLSVRTERNRLTETALSEDSRSFLSDLSRIEDLENADSISPGESSEQDLYELIDYCRLGVIGVFMDLGKLSSPPEQGYSAGKPEPKSLN